ncbi:hypothetical protein GCM10027075_08650 [Streptomyces heilongjiangensis]
MPPLGLPAGPARGQIIKPPQRFLYASRSEVDRGSTDRDGVCPDPGGTRSHGAALDGAPQPHDSAPRPEPAAGRIAFAPRQRPPRGRGFTRVAVPPAGRRTR